MHWNRYITRTALVGAEEESFEIERVSTVFHNLRQRHQEDVW